MRRENVNESARLAALYELEVMDTPPDAHLDVFVKSAALTCDVPISLITLIDSERQWFKANVGLPGVTQTDRQLAFCNYTIQQDEILEVTDAQNDTRFSNNPLVLGDPEIRFYAGAPLTLENGARVGSLCVIDRQPRKLSQKQLKTLEHLAQAIAQALHYRKTTSQLRESEARFRALSAAAPLGVFATDAMGACTYTNAKLQSILGIDEASAMDDGWTAVLHPEDKERVFSDWRNSVSLGEVFETEFRTNTPDGRVVHARVLSQPTYGDAGKVTGHVGSVEDITLRREQEQALQKSESLLKHTGTLANIGGWELEIATGDLAWSEQTCRIHGLPSDYKPTLSEAIGFYTKESQAVIQVAVQSAIDLGKGWDLELPLIRADGESIWVRSMGYIVYEDNQPVRLLGAFQDITQKVTQCKAIEHAHERMALATDSGSIGIWEWDIALDKLNWTPLMYQLYGLNRGDSPLSYDDWLNCLHPDDKKGAEKTLQDAIDSKNGFDDEFRIVITNGEVRHLRSAARVTRNKCGKAISMVGVNWDVTPLRNLATELAEQHALLQTTLRSIGDAVITTDTSGNVTWLNPTAEIMTSWSVSQAMGLPVTQVFHILSSHSREVAPCPVTTCLRQSYSVGLANNKILLSRHGREYGVEDSAALIRNEQGDVLGVVLVFRDVTEQRRLSTEMAFRATHDSLTGLYNRAEFENQAQQTISQATSNETENALLLVDLDQFKLVNDAGGHAVGDKLLKQFSQLLLTCVRTGDTVARLGGDEFGILLQNCNVACAENIAQKLCNRMDEFRFVHDERRFRIGTSIGLVSLDSRWGNAGEAIKAADVACYAAKSAGRNRVHVWFDTDSCISSRTEDMRWATRLEQALDKNQFVLYMQKITNLSSDNTGLHAEVLLRLCDEDDKLISPDMFIPAAERFHLATRIDRWVLKNAIDKLSALPDRNGVSMLCINLSGQSIGDQVFQRDTIELLANTRAGICERICIEITETAVVSNITCAGIFIDQLHTLGVKIALDDFGAGASSFGYLKSLNVDILKIDGQFIKNMAHDPLDTAAVRCFIDVARVKNLNTVAEYVDSEEVLHNVKRMGIDFAQGFHLNKPAPIEQLFDCGEFQQEAVAEH